MSQQFLNQILQGNVLTRLKELPDNSIDVMITSPPYWALRAYKTEPVIWDAKAGCEHEWEKKDDKLHAGRGDAQKSGKYSDQAKNGIQYADTPIEYSFCTKCGAWRGELGLEPTFELYLQHLGQVCDEIYRVLKPTGTIWINIGDTYNGSGGAGGDYLPGGLKDGQPTYKQTPQKKLARKSLIGIPDRFKTMMIDKGWACIQEIIWYKRNAMASSRKGGFTVDFEKLYFFAKNTEPLFHVNGRASPNYRKKKPTYDQGKENIDWEWVEASEKRLARYANRQPPKHWAWKQVPEQELEELKQKNEPIPKHWQQREDCTVWRICHKRTLWESVDYYFETQYEPYSEATLAEIEKAYTGKGRKDYDSALAQNPSDVKRSIIESVKTGIKFGGNKAAGYGNETYSGKEWEPKLFAEIRVPTRPGIDTGNGKSGTEDDPNAGLHNSELSTKREQIVRIIDGQAFGRIKRCVWDITTKGFSEAHFATFPEDLIETPIKSSCPEYVCKKCGTPRVPIWEPTEEYKAYLGRAWHDHEADMEQGQLQDHSDMIAPDCQQYRIIGLSDCQCGAGFEPGIVLDPFMGSGTVAVVAKKLARNFVGIELNREYIDMAKRRLEPYLHQDTLLKWAT